VAKCDPNLEHVLITGDALGHFFKFDRVPHTVLGLVILKVVFPL